VPRRNNAELAATRASADCSAELHRQAVLLELRLAGNDDELALAICDRDGDVRGDHAVPRRTACVARVEVARSRNRDHHHYGLDELVASYTLSFEHGIQKPDPRLFEIALQAMSTMAQHTLMVGDNPRRDCGAVALGMTTLILPPVPNFSERGLDVVLRLVA